MIDATAPAEERDFAAIAAKVEPIAKRIMAQYPPANVRSALIPVLHEFQNVEGWVSPEAIARTAEWIGEPISVVESTASFYTLFHRRPVGRYMLQPCRNLSCSINGAGASARPSTDTGTPDSKAMTSSVGSIAVGRVIV